jgi:hypothetical protein
MMGACRDIIL